MHTKPKTESDPIGFYKLLGVLVVVLGTAVYASLALSGSAATAAQLGDAVGPMASMLTALALFAAIEGVRLQREELKLQREELAANREVMQDQARAAQDSAEVQKRLADAQEALTRRQHESNVRSHYAQIASIETEALQLAARIAEVRHSDNSTSDLLANELDEVRLRLVKLREYYADKAGKVVGVIHINGHIDRDSAGPTS